jgi:hypothetical protein
MEAWNIVFVTIMVILNNDSNDAKNDDESKDRDIMGNNG